MHALRTIIKLTWRSFCGAQSQCRVLKVVNRVLGSTSYSLAQTQLYDVSFSHNPQRHRQMDRQQYYTNSRSKSVDGYSLPKSNDGAWQLEGCELRNFQQFLQIYSKFPAYYSRVCVVDIYVLFSLKFERMNDLGPPLFQRPQMNLVVRTHR